MEAALAGAVSATGAVRNWIRPPLPCSSAAASIPRWRHPADVAAAEPITAAPARRPREPRLSECRRMGRGDTEAASDGGRMSGVCSLSRAPHGGASARGPGSTDAGHHGLPGITVTWAVLRGESVIQRAPPARLPSGGMAAAPVAAPTHRSPRQPRVSGPFVKWLDHSLADRKRARVGNRSCEHIEVAATVASTVTEASTDRKHVVAVAVQSLQQVHGCCTAKTIQLTSTVLWRITIAAYCS